ncbi:ferritin-like protein [Paucibacter sp. O1-1]|nr:ferritin-like protein [Paucibacter sp. O1-1]MDA3830891.1 ferritin-like protein [Paucibacter sp. O1-1]
MQYLYAAYSLGGPQVPPEHRERVRGWQEIILGIAKEEMGHLICIQNVLRLIGAPLNLARDDYPWDVPFYPFPFTLERLTLDSLAKYVYAESPQDWSEPRWPTRSVRASRLPSTPNPHRVSELFALMIQLVSDPDYIPDSAFQATTYPFQASWDEWGRGDLGRPAR